MKFLADPVLCKPWVEVKGKLKFEERVGAGRRGVRGLGGRSEAALWPQQDAEGRQTQGGGGIQGILPHPGVCSSFWCPLPVSVSGPWGCSRA